MKALAIILAVIFLALSAVYLIPHGPLGHHYKHAALFFVLAVLSLVWLRFQPGGASAPSRR
ncbi:MAG: hypothetical protein WAJ85_06975 [Candidatus Baltobacteraceae bacterium]|jgi:hypothetical protein